MVILPIHIIEQNIQNIKALDLMVSDRKICPCFPNKGLCKTCDPVARPFLAPGACFEQMVEVHKVILHIKYQGFMPFGFKNEDFFKFPYISLCKTCDPRVRPFWPQAHDLNKLDRGLLDDAVYQCGFRREDFSSFHLDHLFLACVIYGTTCI